MTYEEAAEEYREKMGNELGPIFHRLWTERALLHMRWEEYDDMFGTAQEDFELMNNVAPGFFKTVQDTGWESILLKLCHFADPAKVGPRRTLSLETLLQTKGAQNVPNLKELVDIAQQQIKFAKDWRNRHIAHADLEYQLEKKAKPLASASRAQVREALKCIDAVLRAVSLHLTATDTYFEGAGHKWGRTLLHQLRAFSSLRDEREKRLLNGLPREEDFDYEKWRGI